MAIVHVLLPELRALAACSAAALAAVCLAFALACAVTATRKWLCFRRHANRFPCKPAKPLVGHLLDCGLFASVPTLLQYFTSECIRLRTGQALFGPFRNIFIADPKDIQVFVTNSKNQSKTFLYNFTSQAIGEGLVSISGEKWRRHHKIIAPVFYTDVLDTLVPIFNRHSDQFVENLRLHANGEAFDVAPVIETLAFDIICETAMGIKEKSQDDHEYHRALEQVTTELTERIKRPWLYPEFLYRMSSGGRKAAKAHEILRNAQRKGISDRASRLKVTETEDESTEKKRRQAFIDVLLQQQQNGAPISDQEIAEEIDTLMFTGFDTVKLSVSFALYALAQNPAIQENIFQEIQSLFHPTERIDVTAETLRRMPYLEKVFKETLRLHPPVWFFARKAGVDVPLVSCDLVIPAGADVIIPVKAVHMDPKLYPHPEVFDRERFSVENTANRHPYGFLPFGSGQRTCIGRRYAMLEAKTILAKLIWHYEIFPEPSYIPQYTWGITSPPTNGMWIKLQERTR